MSYAVIAARLGKEPIPFLHPAAPSGWVRPKVPATRRRRASVKPAVARSTVTAPAVQAAYHRLTARNGSDSVFISELATEAGVPVPMVREHILSHPTATLDEGDWSYASPGQRAAHIMLRDHRRLYVRFD